MSFGSDLHGWQSHEALLRVQDYEISLLENVRKCLVNRAKCDREYVASLSSVVGSVTQKLGSYDCETPTGQARLACPLSGLLIIIIINIIIIILTPQVVKISGVKNKKLKSDVDGHRSGRVSCKSTEQMRAAQLVRFNYLRVVVPQFHLFYLSLFVFITPFLYNPSF